MKVDFTIKISGILSEKIGQIPKGASMYSAKTKCLLWNNVESSKPTSQLSQDWIKFKIKGFGAVSASHFSFESHN